MNDYFKKTGRLDNSKTLQDFTPKELIEVLEVNHQINPMDLSYICSEIIRREIKYGRDTWMGMEKG